MAPRMSGATSGRRDSNSVTTPKLPPPPRRPQNSSSFSVALARTTRPSAVTTSAEMRLSGVSPHLPLGPAAPAAQGQAGDSGGRVAPAGHGEPERLRGGVEVPPRG